jgi:hypothetical protein
MEMVVLFIIQALRIFVYQIGFLVTVIKKNFHPFPAVAMFNCRIKHISKAYTVSILLLS